MALRGKRKGVSVGNVGPESTAIGSDGGTIGVDGIADSSADENGLIIIDPIEFGGDGAGSDIGSNGDTSGEPRKRRGRKPGSGSARSGKTQALDINGIEKILFSTHMLLAGLVKTPELALDANEASELAKAIGSVSRHYDVSASAKTVDIANLVMVCGMVYGTRLLAVRARTRKEKNDKTAQEGTGGVVFPFPPLKP